MRLMAGRGEELETHLREVGRLSEALAARLAPELKELAYLAGALHDIGKALTLYRVSQLKYLAHEVASSFVALEVCAKLGLREEDRYAVVHAVLFHMQAYEAPGTRVRALYAAIRRRGIGVRYEERAARVLARLLLRWGVSEEDAAEMLSRGAAEFERGLRARQLGGGPVATVLARASPRLAGGGLLDDAASLHRCRVLAGLVMVADKWVSVIRRGGARSLYFTCVDQLLKGLGVV